MLISDLTATLDERLAQADADLARRYPGPRPDRQPVHTVYVPADRFSATLAHEWGAFALAALESTDIAAEIDLPADVAADVTERTRHKLATEPVEDLRIDFEDGFGARSDADEDAAVDAAAAELVRAIDDGTAPPYTGIRFKSFEAPSRARGVRTLVRFLSAITHDGRLPDGFVVTLPKVTSVEQVEAMVDAAAAIESELQIRSGAVQFEIQVETPQAILGPDGRALVAPMIHASAGRCTALHYGTYDYSASCGIAAAQQSMEHPAADHAKAVMQVAAAGTGVRLSDGSTNVLPVGDAAQAREARRLHARLVRRSLERGYYQGWDLHAGQLPTRYLATFAFYREGLAAACDRLKNYVSQQDSAILDEPATARALADFVVRALDCGATDDAEVAALTGLDRPSIDRLALRTPSR
ncbi:DUF6986 family protein [Luteipulveratus halotolerans]|uniref:Aldolase n=1 Tax=Luteipulveratus halotolerans TaxID=1631356 RepID=A0A0L6CE13_9MICO|nr:aldolase/citrate lyase family protein [Luteipulveratus halotolerans]KNX36037.1 aldolase [Luteipulveratus halotolerans]